MRVFSFKYFDVQQNKNVFRVGTDAVLLGALSDVSFARSILEVGTGTGIISLMLAQRNNLTRITALDIDDNAFRLASVNFENSPFKERLSVVNQDFKLFSSDNKFDLIISNPPYFDVNDSEKDVVARQKIELDFQDLINNAIRLLSIDGVFTVIIPSLDADYFESVCQSQFLFLKRKIEIKGAIDSQVKRVVLEFVFDKTRPILERFVIEKSPRQYSDEYLELTKDFHVFKNKKL